MPELDFASTNVWFGISCAIDAIVVLWAVSARRVLAVAGAVVLLALKGVAMIAVGLDVPFGVAHVLWLDLAIVVPLAGLVLFAATRRAIALVAVLAAPVAAYASLLEPERLVTERATVPLAAERAGRAPVRVAVLADLQFERLGDHERDAVDRVMRERPDLILLPGDFHQGSAASFARERPAVHALLSRLHTPGGVFAVEGDVEDVAELRRLVAGTGVRPLVDETARVRVRDRTLRVVGVRREYDLATLRAAERSPGAHDVRILLSHRPDVVLALRPRTRIDLVVAGHTHGGQLQLPLFGPPFTASEIPRDVAAGGLHALDGRRVYVSRGVGVERGQAPKLRFRARPEVSILTLR